MVGSGDGSPVVSGAVVGAGDGVPPPPSVVSAQPATSTAITVTISAVLFMTTTPSNRMTLRGALDNG
ncbi:hypothetical protein GCM10009743_43140 [Kribbella swartbergensis]